MKGGIRLYINFFVFKNPTKQQIIVSRRKDYLLEIFVITAYNKRPSPETFVHSFFHPHQDKAAI